MSYINHRNTWVFDQLPSSFAFSLLIFAFSLRLHSSSSYYYYFLHRLIRYLSLHSLLCFQYYFGSSLFTSTSSILYVSTSIRFYAFLNFLRCLLPRLLFFCLQRINFFTYLVFNTLVIILDCSPLDTTPSHVMSVYVLFILSSHTSPTYNFLYLPFFVRALLI